MCWLLYDNLYSIKWKRSVGDVGAENFRGYEIPGYTIHIMNICIFIQNVWHWFKQTCLHKALKIRVDRTRGQRIFSPSVIVSVTLFYWSIRYHNRSMHSLYCHIPIFSLINSVTQLHFVSFVSFITIHNTSHNYLNPITLLK